MKRSLVLLALSGALWITSSAQAQAGGSRLHIGAGLSLDVGGEVEIGNYDDDLDATPGLRGHVDYAVHRYVSVGGLLRLSWWEPDDTNFDRSFLMDLGPRVIGHYDWRKFRFYAGLSPGLTISAIDDGVNIENPAAGFTMTLTVAGVEWWFTRKVGLFAEIGWIGHWFEHEYENQNNDVDFELSQAMLVPVGVVFGT